MCGVYNTPPKLGTALLLKFWNTSSDIFNRNILNYCADTNEMETKYYSKEPHLMENENDYEKYGPVGVCGYIQD